MLREGGGAVIDTQSQAEKLFFRAMSGKPEVFLHADCILPIVCILKTS